MKKLPLVFIFAVCLVKTAFFSRHFSSFEWLAWLLTSGGALYVSWAYWRDKNLPARSGNFKFEEGKNSTARALYVAVIGGMYIAAAIYT